MLSLEVLLWSLAIAFAILYLVSFRWACRVLGERETEGLAPARALGPRGHRGFGEEPTWVRSVQSAIVAFGVSGLGMCVVGFVGLGAYALFG
jgi:hypothetical protein